MTAPCWRIINNANLHHVYARAHYLFVQRKHTHTRANNFQHTATSFITHTLLLGPSLIISSIHVYTCSMLFVTVVCSVIRTLVAAGYYHMYECTARCVSGERRHVKWQIACVRYQSKE